MTHNQRMARRGATAPICTAVAVLCFLTPAGRPGTAEAQCTPGWKPGLGMAGVNGTVRAMTVWDDGNGPALYMSGGFSVAGDVLANGIARWDGQQWAPLGSGVGGLGGRALTVYNGELIAGGGFTTVGGVTFNGIARWDGQQWLPLGSGTRYGGQNGQVHALAVYNGELIAGGEFSTAGGVSANHIARWDGQEWSPLGSGMSGAVYTLTVYNGELIAGGRFTSAGAVAASRIARWDGQQWSSLGSGMASSLPDVLALTVYNGELIAGGAFWTAGGVSALRIARWDGDQWRPLSSGMSGGYGPNVNALAVYNGELVAGGRFTTAGGVAVNRIARWDGQQWAPLGNGVGGYDVRALTVYNGELIAGGEFTTAGDVSSNDIARWNGQQWAPLALGSGMNGGRVHALTVYNGELIAGGRFYGAGGVIATYIGRWDGQQWAPLGSGMGGSDQSVLALAVYNGELIAGGNFTTAGGVAVNRIARWDGQQWAPLGNGVGGGDVRALTVYNGELIAGGRFWTAGGVSANYIARWNGQQWAPLGNGMGGSSSSVSSLAVYNGELIAGGEFTTTADGVTVNGIARWDGQQWSPLGSGMSYGAYSATVVALAVYNGELVAGGGFSTAGGIVAHNIARWDGQQWAPLGTGRDPGVRALAVYNGELIAGGSFGFAGGVGPKGIARWDGQQWAPLGSGMNNWVYALTPYNGELVAGGSFETAGGQVSAYWARWDGCLPQQWVYNSAFLTDAQMEQYGTMNIEQAGAFLTAHNSYFGQPVSDVDGEVFDMSAVIVDAANQHQINPQVLLTTLQKESVAVTTPSRPSPTRMSLLMGAGAPSTAREQVYEAARLYRAYLDELDADGVTRSGWRVGVGKMTVDDVFVTPATRAVAALFTYTPYAGAQWGGNQPQWGGTYLFHHYWQAFGFGSAAPSLSAPTGLSASAVSGSGIALAWDALDDVLAYRLERKVAANDSWAIVATPGAAATTHEDTGLSSNTTYYYRLAASRTAGLSPYSRTASASPDDALAPRIANLSPLMPMASGSSEAMTIRGANFGSSPVVTLRDIDSGIVHSDVGITAAGDTEIAIVYNFGTAPGRWSVSVSNAGGSWSPELHFGTTVSAALLTDGFNYPIGNGGKAYDWNVPSDLTRNDLYQVPIPASYVDMPPDRGGSGTNFSLGEWYNAQDVGSFLGWYGGTLYGGIHSGEDWNHRDGSANRPVYAVAHGQVVRVTGQTVILRHCLPWLQRVYSRYLHVNPGVNVGEWVPKGQQIAMTAPIEVPHLHFEMREKWSTAAASGTLNVRDKPAGVEIATVSAGDEGLIIDGPIAAELDGTEYPWWKVKWANGVLGWSAEVGLDLRIHRTANPKGYYTHIRGGPSVTTMTREQVEETYRRIKEDEGVVDASDFLSDHSYIPLRHRIMNGLFEGLSLAGWVTGGTGTAEVVPSNGSSTGAWARLTTSSPVTLSQQVTTHQDPFELGFTYHLIAASGSLDVLLDSTVLATIVASDPPQNQAETFNILVSDPELLGREDATLTFRFDGPGGSELLLSNIVFATILPPPPPPVIPGDFDGDGDVDGEDLAILIACVTGPQIPYDPNNLPLGCTLTPDDEGIIAADFARNGDVDLSDFGVFQRCYSGEGNPADPDCMGALTSGNVTLISAVSRRTHGTAGDFDLNLALEALPSTATVEHRADGPTRIILTFSTAVASGTGSSSLGTLSDGPGPDQKTVTLTEAVSGSCLEIAVSGITSPTGTPMSGDSLVRLRVQASDVTGDGSVNILDLVQVRNQLNQPVTVGNFRADVNADGVINILDLVNVRNNLNQSISCP